MCSVFFVLGSYLWVFLEQQPGKQFFTEDPRKSLGKHQEQNNDSGQIQRNKCCAI